MPLYFLATRKLYGWLMHGLTASGITRSTRSPKEHLEIEIPLSQYLLMSTFASTLDLADQLSLDEQEELSETLRRRVAEKRRAELIAAVKDARTEFAAGKIKAASPAAILRMLKA